MKTELKVGLFAVIVIILLAYMTFQVSGLGVAWKKGYTLYVVFDNISGLDEKSRVKVAGVDAGVVGNVRLKNGMAKLSLLIDPDVKIYADAKASLRVAGLLGDKYLAIWSGTPSERPLKDGDVITNTEAPIDIDALANELTSAATYINDLAEALLDIFGEDERGSLKDTIYNLQSVTASLDEILEEGKEPIKSTIVKLEDFSSVLQDKGPGLIDDLSAVAKDLRALIGENRYALKESIENLQSATKSADSIAQKLEKGEGTIGKLLHDEKLYDSVSGLSEGIGKGLDVVNRLRTFVDFRAEYLRDNNDWKGYFNLTLKPKEDYYYILGAVSDNLGSAEITDITIDGVTVRKEEVKREIEFTAQFAKRINDLALRVGLMENTFGFGADYFLKFMGDDRVKISADIWDFNADEAGADDAHLRVGLDYTLFKYIFISTGLDNILNSKRRGLYVGGGIKFEDEDLKYLMGSLPGMSVK